LLELFSEISKAVRGMLYIIGEGSELEGIKRRIVELGLREKVIMVGKTREVEKYMFMSDVFLLPSFHEGNPIVTAEAQAAGLPCYISDRVTKLAKLLEESKFIGIDDAKESASMIIKDIRNGAYLTDRKKAIDIVKESGYDRKIQVEQLEKIYMSV
jgi:glycosyltransferase involved in cell wall biosynthesis